MSLPAARTAPVKTWLEQYGRLVWLSCCSGPDGPPDTGLTWGEGSVSWPAHRAARTLAEDRRIRCVVLDYDALRGADSDEFRFF